MKARIIFLCLPKGLRPPDGGKTIKVENEVVAGGRAEAETNAHVTVKRRIENH